MDPDDRETPPVKPAWVRFLSFLVAVAVGMGGIVLDGSLYRKLLIECLPFKIMDVPPASFYAAIGEHATLGLIVLGSMVALLLRRRAPHWIPLGLTAGAPLLVLLILGIGAVWYGPSPEYAPDFDGMAAIDDFFVYGFCPAALIALGAWVVTLPLWPSTRSAAADAPRC